MQKKKSEKKSEPREITYQAWLDEGKSRFGSDRKEWKFKCPVCGHVAFAKDWLTAGSDENGIAFSCVGRWLPKCRDAIYGKGKGPCNYSGGGLFQLNPVHIEYDDGSIRQTFEFA